MGPVVGARFSHLAIAASLCWANHSAGCASAVPADRRSPSPRRPSPRPETFVSDRYGFSVAVPAGLGDETRHRGLGCVVPMRAVRPDVGWGLGGQPPRSGRNVH